MIVVASKSGSHKTFHYPKCKYAKRINEDNILYFNSKDDARAYGYTHCMSCSILFKRYKEDKEKINSFLKSHGLKMYIEDDSMFIDNTFSSWKITTEPKSYNLALFHANTEQYYKLKKKNGHIIHHYHRQNYRGKSNILDMLQYIVEHDEWKSDNIDKYKSMPRKSKKQRKRYREAERIANKIKNRNIYNLIERVSIEDKNKRTE